MDNRTRLNRLKRLRGVVELHKGKRGKPVKLNGISRSWNMMNWDCGTSACALGNYALTPYGKRHFGWPTAGGIVEKTTQLDASRGAAAHFGIRHREAVYLFEDNTDAPPSEIIRRIDVIINRYSK